MIEVNTRITRILELPALIGAELRRLVAFRAERRKLEAKLAQLEASIRIATLGKPEYQQLKNAADRDAYLIVACGQSEAWTKTTDRIDELSTAIDKHVAERDVLEHERKALKAALEREYALIIDKALSDEALTRALAAHPRTSA